MSSPTIEITVNFDKRNYKMIVNSNLTVGELNHLILEHFQVDSSTYCLIHKADKISLDDVRSILILFSNEKNPLFFLLKKTSIMSIPLISKTIRIVTKLTSKQFLMILNDYFIYKNINFNSKIISQGKGYFEVQFANSNISKDFLKYFNSIHNSNNINIGNSIYKQSITRTNNSLKNAKSASECYLYTKQLMSKKEHKFFKNQSFVNKYNNRYKYRTFEENKRLENYNDKKNWIDKHGFISCVGNYSKKYKIIKNNVGMTPSLPPLLYNYRKIDKNKWLTAKGFN